MILMSMSTRSQLSKRSQTTLDYIRLLDRDSTIVGKDAMAANSLGIENTVFGYEAASLGSTGDLNVVVGTRAGQRAAGSRNTVVGTHAFASNVSGYDNAVFGYEAGAAGPAGDENTFAGARAGLRVTTSANVAVGFASCAGAGACSAGGNAAVGWRSEAAGGGALALGAEARATAEGAVALGAGVECAGSNSVAAGTAVTVTGSGSLVLMPRRDGMASSHALNEELNVYGVLTGAREASTGVYRAQLSSDSVRLEAGGNAVFLDGNTTQLYARSNVVVVSPLLAAGGLRVNGGDCRIDTRTTFNDPAQFNADVLFTGNVSTVRGASVGGDLRVGGKLILSQPTSPEDAVFASATVLGDASVCGTLSAGLLTASNVAAGRVAALELTAARMTFSEPLVLAGGGGISNAGPTLLSGYTEFSGPSAARAVAGLDVSGDVLRALAGMRIEGSGDADFLTPAHFHDSAYFHSAHADNLSASDFSVTGTQSNSGLTIMRAAEADTLLAGYLTVASNLAVVGAWSCDDFRCRLLTVDELARAQNLDVSGLVYSGGAMGGQLVFGSNAAFSNLRVGDGGAVINGDLVVNGTITGLVGLDIGASVDQNVVFKNDVTVLGSITGIRQATFAGGVQVTGGELETDEDIVLHNRLDPLGLSLWRIRLTHPDAGNHPEYADLEIRSWKNCVTTFTQDFEQGVLNFTGSHRCAADGGPDAQWLKDAPVGSILVATGRYRALDGGEDPRVSESLPVVAPSRAPRDPRAFGVLASAEEEGGGSDGGRRFRLATMCFSMDRADPDDRRVVVNSAGEGAVLVCDEAGPVRNGDLIVTSSFRGVGMRQGEDDTVRSYTVAKATCDAPYDDPRGAWRWARCPDTGVLRRLALVGCVYKF